MQSIRHPGFLWAVLLPLVLCGGMGLRSSRAEEKGEQSAVLELIGPARNEVIADVGCGKGTWTFPLARSVSPGGKVYAVDIDIEKIEFVRKRQEREGVRNIQTIHSLPDDPMLPKDTLDAVFLNDVISYVGRSALAGFLRGIWIALKPSGRLVIQDPNGNPDRIVAECYRAGFSLVQAEVPLREGTRRAFSPQWYALKFRRAEEMQPAILPSLGKPARYRTRLHLAEELFRLELISREELRVIWERIENAPGEFDPKVDEHLDLIRAAQAIGVVSEDQAEAMRQRIR